jgi:hypothetical protein
MALKVEDLEDQTKYRQILKIPYDELANFVLDYIKRRTGLMLFFWSVCILTLLLAITIRINIGGYYPFRSIFFHTILGLVVFPVLYIPVHEFLHIIPFYLSGAKRIRIGVDLKQYLFYVSAHRYVANREQFSFVAYTPFAVTGIALVLLIFTAPGLWKWSLSLFLFVHTTMCAGDFAMLNLYTLHKGKNIYTWDDVDEKIAYFYEEI